MEAVSSLTFPQEPATVQFRGPV